MKPLPIALAVICFVIGALYLAGVLQLGVSHSELGKHHLGHASLFAALGVLALVWGRFSSAPTTRRP